MNPLQGAALAPAAAPAFGEEPLLREEAVAAAAGPGLGGGRRF